ncbi:MAG: hypothetical protein ABIV93_14770 [Byssovorax sp.]
MLPASVRLPTVLQAAEKVRFAAERGPTRLGPGSYGRAPAAVSSTKMNASKLQADGFDGLVDTDADSCATSKLVERAILGHLAHRILDALRGHFRKDDGVPSLGLGLLVEIG